ncbi:MAG TPA: DUF480 domain-containing protein [Phycisphaerales bacterium]|nr:DUF480 domain-containing protein [Phycisphaerales bacterium]HMP38493.1 DUF480 domain-containing protein [Phycisphaerales bacterium]
MLTSHECRVLGTLVEKAQTTPGQYPLTLNALVNGCNQKNNRDPVTSIDEEQALAALDALRAKGLVREVSMDGSRVAKFRHVAREGLEVDTASLVILAELLLRGPQTVGELRGRATRMHPLESMEVVETVLAGLAGRPEPLVREVAPAPGSRAPRWAQMLCPTLHPIDGRPPAQRRDGAEIGGGAGAGVAGRRDELAERVDDVAARLERLEREVTLLRAAIGGGAPARHAAPLDPPDRP